MNAAARFWSNVDVDGAVPVHAPELGPCWMWTASCTGGGYGVIAAGHRNWPAHRFSYEMLRGPIPEGHLIDHRCHVYACVNPTHLRPATHKQNMENKLGASSLSTTGIRGVFYSAQTGKWSAEVRHEYETYAKRFDTAEDAERWVIATRNALYSHNDADRRLSNASTEVALKQANPINAEFGKRVRKVLESRSHDPIAYGEQVGIGRVSMIRRLRGTAAFTMDEIAALAHALGCPIADLWPEPNGGTAA